MTAEELARILRAKRTGEEWIARCPAHDDKNPSLSIGEGEDGRVLIKCHAGCKIEDICEAEGLHIGDLFPKREGGRAPPPEKRSTPQPADSTGLLEPTTFPRDGLSLAEYAVSKRLPTKFLQSLGLTEITYDRSPAVRIPYVGEDGLEKAVRFRIAPSGDRFRWRKNSKPVLYGLDQLSKARQLGHIALVEGESDCHTLWYHSIPAVGLPGASSWNEQRDAGHFEGIETVYVVVEPDSGGEKVLGSLSRSSLRDRVKLVHLPEKDASALHLRSPQEFKRTWDDACQKAKPWSSLQAEIAERKQEAHWTECSSLACKPDILFEFDRALDELGLAGERRAAKIIFLALVSRLLDRPVSVAVKGPSSGGKSHLVQTVLNFFPPQAYYSLTGLSDRALAYGNEPLQNRFLVIYEAAGMSSEMATYLMRSLLSENCVRYETVEKTNEGLKSRTIERQGPTGLLTTTTQLGLHPENETRLLSLTITDTQEQTQAVFHSLAKQGSRPPFDYLKWHAFQQWMALQQSSVIIPYAEALATLVLPVHTRLRRDFKMLLSLICAHALVHQASREKDSDGNIIAAFDDYRVVHELFADLLATGVNQIVKPEVREVVDAVASLGGQDSKEVRQKELAEHLKLDKSAISRRVRDAVSCGYLDNLEERKGRPAKLVLGEPLPADQEVLPSPEALSLAAKRMHGCTLSAGNTAPYPHVGEFQAHQSNKILVEFSEGESAPPPAPNPHSLPANSLMPQKLTTATLSKKADRLEATELPQKNSWRVVL